MCLLLVPGSLPPAPAEIADDSARSDASESIEKLLEKAMDESFPETGAISKQHYHNHCGTKLNLYDFPPKEVHDPSLKSLNLQDVKAIMKKHGAYDSPEISISEQINASSSLTGGEHLDTPSIDAHGQSSEVETGQYPDGDPKDHSLKSGIPEGPPECDIPGDVSKQSSEPPLEVDTSQTDVKQSPELLGRPDAIDAAMFKEEPILVDMPSFAGLHPTDDEATDRQNYLAKREFRLHDLEKQFRFPTSMISKLMNVAGILTTSCDDVQTIKEQMGQPGRQWLSEFTTKIKDLKFSASFSGIDIPCVSSMMFGAAAQAMLDIDASDVDSYKHYARLPKSLNLYAVEIYGPSREELLNSSNPPCCLFGDVNDFWNSELKGRVKGLRENHLLEKVLVPLVMSGEAVVDHAWCYHCGKMCKASEADVHLAGTSCAAFSRKGSRLQLLDDTALDLMAWIAQRRRTQEKIIVQENVEEFCTEDLISWLGDLYSIQVVLLDPKNFGWPIRRPRKYHVCVHRNKAGTVSCPLDMFARLFLRHPIKELLENSEPRWTMFFVAEEKDLENEIHWACQRATTWATEHDSWVLPWSDLTTNGSFWKSLTQFERNNLAAYQERWPGQTFQLNQNATVTPTRSDDFHMPTLIRNAGIIWTFG